MVFFSCRPHSLGTIPALCTLSSGWYDDEEIFLSWQGSVGTWRKSFSKTLSKPSFKSHKFINVRIRIRTFKTRTRIGEKTRIHPDPDPKHWAKYCTEYTSIREQINTGLEATIVWEASYVWMAFSMWACQSWACDHFEHCNKQKATIF